MILYLIHLHHILQLATQSSSHHGQTHQRVNFTDKSNPQRRREVNHGLTSQAKFSSKCSAHHTTRDYHVRFLGRKGTNDTVLAAAPKSGFWSVAK